MRILRGSLNAKTTLVSLSVCISFGGLTPSQAQDKKPIHDGRREQSQITKEFNGNGLDLIPNQAEMTPSEFNYFPTMMQTLIQMEANTLSTTAEIYQAIENLEKIYRASVKAADQHLLEMQGKPYQEPDSRIYMSAQVQQAVAQLEQLRKGLASCRENENCVTEIDGKLLTFKELARLYEIALSQNGEFFRTYAKALMAWDQATQVYEFRVREAYNKIIPAKMASLRSEISQSKDMSADERAYHIQYWNNIQLQNRLEELEKQALYEPQIAAVNAQKLQNLRAEFEAVRELLEAQAGKNCGTLSWSCKKERDAAREKLEGYKKLLGITHSGGRQ